MALISLSQPHFPAGQVVMTAGISELVQRGIYNPVLYLQRHLNGDWGDICDEDRRLNDDALASDGRLFSSYKITPTLKIWIITEWDRSVTTLLLPDEY